LTVFHFGNVQAYNPALISIPSPEPMQKKESFLTPEEHFSSLVAQLGPRPRQLYEDTRHARIEMGFRNRPFVVYEIEGRDPKVLDTVAVADFDCNDLDGASVELRSRSGSKLLVSYGPTQLFDYPVFISLPLSMSVHWQMNQSGKQQLRFPLYIRTQSRKSLRERGVVYFEPAATFHSEFGTIAA
jgi:hypothetical protein